MIGPGLNGDDVIGGAIKRTLDFDLQAARRMPREDHADDFGPAWYVNADGVAFPNNIGLLAHKIAEFSVHRLSPSFFGIEGYGQGVSFSVLAELLDDGFFEPVQLIQKQGLQIKRGMPGERQADNLGAGLKVDKKSIARSAFDLRAVFDETNATQSLDLSSPRCRVKFVERVKDSPSGRRERKIFVFIGLLPAFNQQRFYIHFIRHFPQFSGVYTKPCGLCQLVFSCRPFCGAGHFNNRHLTASLPGNIRISGGSVMAETGGIVP